MIVIISRRKGWFDILPSTFELILNFQSKIYCAVTIFFTYNPSKRIMFTNFTWVTYLQTIYLLKILDFYRLPFYATNIWNKCKLYIRIRKYAEVYLRFSNITMPDKTSINKIYVVLHRDENFGSIKISFKLRTLCST